MVNTCAHCERTARPKTMMSSMKKLCETNTDLQTRTPTKFPSLVSYEILWLSPSMTNINSSGDSEEPCLSSHPALKKPEVNPFMMTTKEEKLTQFITHSTFLYDMPILVSMIHRYSQSTQSYAFDKSTFITIDFMFCV